MLASLKPLCVGIVADTTHESSRGRVYGYLQLCVTLGMMAAASIATPISGAEVLGIKGWRVAFVLFGCFALLTGFVIQVFMQEVIRAPSVPTDDQHPQRGCKAIGAELRKLGGYCAKPSFICLVAQGLFGAIPWNAFTYSTFYFQVNGLSDASAAALATMFQLSCAFGNVIGGFVGDFMAHRCENHGRPFTANISVSSGIPCAFFIFTTPHRSFGYYATFLVLMGLSSTWCAVGVNWPILSEIVDPESRSGIMAWEAALEGAVAACLGNAAVGFLAQNVFRFDLEGAKAASATSGEHNAEALGKALALTAVLPWSVCFVCYIFLHWAFRHDRKAMALRNSSRRVQIQAVHSPTPLKIGAEESSP